LPNIEAISTPTGADPVKESVIDDGMRFVRLRSSGLIVKYRYQGHFGLTEGITQNAAILHDATRPEERPEAGKTLVDRPSKEQLAEPALGETLPVDSLLASESCDQTATKEEAVGGLANENPQSIEVHSTQQPPDAPNDLQPRAVGEFETGM